MTQASSNEGVHKIMAQIPGYARDRKAINSFNRWVAAEAVDLDLCEEKAWAMVSCLTHKDGRWEYQGLHGKRYYTHLYAALRIWIRRGRNINNGVRSTRVEAHRDAKDFSQGW